MANELLEQARGGDRDAFAALVEPHRAELQVHCYRMLGSLQDAEDAVQETLLAAWLGLDGFEGRSSLRTWLYRIATNRCLNQLRSTSRRPASAAALPAPAPAPSGLGEVLWLQPYPDVLLDALVDEAPGPEARYESREAISLAFITAMQLLPPAQRAVLLLRDVLGYRASEAAALLSTTEDSVTNALKRARASLATRAREPAPVTGADERELLRRFVDAFTADDTAALIALMSEDIWVRMPPLPFEYRGREAAGRFFAAVGIHRRSIGRMEPVGVNRQPGFGEYVRDSNSGLLRLAGVIVLEVSGGLVSEVTHFETTVAPYLGLPRTLRAD